MNIGESGYINHPKKGLCSVTLVDILAGGSDVPIDKLREYYAGYPEYYINKLRVKGRSIQDIPINFDVIFRKMRKVKRTRYVFQFTSGYYLIVPADSCTLTETDVCFPHLYNDYALILSKKE